MTQYQSRILAHLVWMHSLEPVYAEKAARHYAKIDPHELEAMPELLKQHLLVKPTGTRKPKATS